MDLLEFNMCVFMSFYCDIKDTQIVRFWLINVVYGLYHYRYYTHPLPPPPEPRIPTMGLRYLFL